MWVSVDKISASDRLYKSSGADIFAKNPSDIRKYILCHANRSHIKTDTDGFIIYQNSQIISICEKSPEIRIKSGYSNVLTIILTIYFIKRKI